jgi:poly(3-hydroxybutyrate) depolymerase
MTSYRLLIQLGTSCLLLGACGAESPDNDGGVSGSGAGSGSPAGGVTGMSGMTTTGGMIATAGVGGTGGNGGQITTGGTVASGGQAGSGGVVDSGGQGGAAAGAAGAGTGGSAGAGGAGGELPLKNAAVPSAGCGKAPMMTTGSKMITSSGDSRHYNITIPASYDMNKPYRVIYASHGLGGDGDDITREKYYGIENIAEAASSTIFIAPSGLGGAWGQKDHPLFDDILALVKGGLCIDTTRVFVTGFSFGGMYSYSLSLNHQKVIRAAAGLGPANYNIWLPTNTKEPIGWMQTTGMSDNTTPWDGGNNRGAKYIAIQHATDNGCTVPATIPTWQSGGTLCYDFMGCKPGYPTKVCTFNGGHSLPGGLSQLVWTFFSQF